MRQMKHAWDTAGHQGQPGHKQGASEQVAGGGKKPTEDPPARSQNC